eukprot:jgi/Chrzof1/5789/Cz16g15260.t1
MCHLHDVVVVFLCCDAATVGVVTERNAEKAIEELKAYEAAAATVLRNGQLQQVSAGDLVPGDIVEIAVGDQIPADVRLIKLMSNILRVDQSILTGESHSVEKHTHAVLVHKAVYQDKVNILFSGTMVTSGRAQGVVIGTGAATAIGRIRDALSQDDDVVTPLKQKLDEFGELLSKVIAVVCVLVWLMNINRFKDPALGGWFQGAVYYFKIAVALAVAAIPEGLPAVVTTCLALGTRKMAKQNAIVRTLPSVETLGCTTVICSDKTGTLTTNQMSVVKVCCLRTPLGDVTEYDVTGTTYSPEGLIKDSHGVVVNNPAQEPCLLQAALCSALCNDSTLVYQSSEGVYQRIGESTELALRVYVEKVGLPPSMLSPGQAWPAKAVVCNAVWKQVYQRDAVLEFTRDRKMMSVLVSDNNQQHLLLCKGAPESVLGRCSHALLNSDGGGPVPMTDNIRRALLERMAQYGGAMALRCLALAYKPAKGMTAINPLDEAGLTFISMMAMHDPPRHECAAAIETCRQAGIRVVVVTGDNQATAEAVCRQIGALGLDHQGSESVTSLTGAEFDALEPPQQSEAAKSVAVFARVEPLHKLRLVEILRSQGHVVAMTGDGVNDAPALMRADIGVAMGSGTAVAKHAADMVLADDNFATIVSAVKEGRAIYANTKQFIRYMISSNIGEVVAIFLAALLGVPEVLTPVQLLWVNLVTDGLPATALGFNKPDKDVMTKVPRRMTEPIVNGWLFFRYIVIGLYVGIVTVIGFLWWFLWFSKGPQMSWSALTHFQKCDNATLEGASYKCDVFLDKHPKTISMTVLVIVEMFNALNNISENSSLLVIPPWDNKWLLAAIMLSIALHCLIMYVSPLALVFGITHLDAAEWWCVILLSAPVILIDEIMKAFSRNLVAARKRRQGNNHGSYQQLIPLSSIQVTSPLVDDKTH